MSSPLRQWIKRPGVANRLHHILMSLLEATSNSRQCSARSSSPHTVTMYGRACRRAARPGTRLLRYAGLAKPWWQIPATAGDAIFAASSVMVARAREISPFLSSARVSVDTWRRGAMEPPFPQRSPDYSPLPRPLSAPQT